MDPAGRLYVCDALHRVLVYQPAAPSGSSATRMIGGVPNGQGLTLNSPQGVFFIGSLPYVVDGGNHRILRFQRYEDWPADVNTPPNADDVIGQESFVSYKANRGLCGAVGGFHLSPVARAGGVF